MQTKFEYSAGGTNNAAKIPHQMSLFIKQHQKLNTSKKGVKINCNVRKQYPPTPKKDNTGTNSRKIQNKYYCILQPELKDA